MGKYPPSLGRYVDWEKVLLLYGIIPQSGLPYVFPCPWCPGTATIYGDVHAGGQWFNCFGCHSFGDTIELARRFYDLPDTESAITKLVRTGLIKRPPIAYDIQRYCTSHIERPARLHKFWDNARRQSPIDDNKEIRRHKQKLRLDATLDPDRWLAGPANFVGHCPALVAEQAFQPTMTSMYDTDSRIFGERGWNNVLAFPFEDVPGHFKGFLFYGHDKGSTRFRMLRYNYKIEVSHTISVHSRSADVDAGLMMWYAAVNSHPVLGQTMFVLADPLIAAALQVRHYVDNSVPLPIVATYQDKSYYSYASLFRHFVGKEVVFVTKPLEDITTTRRAALADGLIYEADLSVLQDEAVPLSGFVTAKARARPWFNVVADCMATVPNNQAEGLFLRLNLPAASEDKLLRACPKALRDILRPVKPSSNSSLSITIDDRTITEKDDGWYYHNTRISDVIIRVHDIVRVISTNTRRYIGVLLFDGQEMPFNVAARELATQPLLWLRDHMTQNGARLPNVQPLWQHRLLDIALGFKLPEVRNVTRVLGWDNVSRSYLFPTFAIGPGGQVRPETAAIAPGIETPGSILPPEEFARDELTPILTNTPENALLWASFVAVIYHLITPQYRYDRSRIIVSTRCASVFSRLASQLGCVSDCGIGWPQLPKNTECTKIAGDDIHWAETINLLVAKCQRHRVVIDVPNVKNELPDELLVAKLLPNFLQWFIRQPRLSLNPSLYDNLRASVMLWLKEEAAVMTKTLNACFKYAAADAAATGLMQLISTLLNDGSIIFTRSGVTKPNARTPALVWLDDTPPCVFVPVQAISRLAYNRTKENIDTELITTSLRAADMLRDVEHRNYIEGWCVYEHHLNKFITKV